MPFLVDVVRRYDVVAIQSPQHRMSALIRRLAAPLVTSCRVAARRLVQLNSTPSHKPLRSIDVTYPAAAVAKACKVARSTHFDLSPISHMGGMAKFLILVRCLSRKPDSSGLEPRGRRFGRACRVSTRCRRARPCTGLRSTAPTGPPPEREAAGARDLGNDRREAEDTPSETPELQLTFQQEGLAPWRPQHGKPGSP